MWLLIHGHVANRAFLWPSQVARGGLAADHPGGGGAGGAWIARESVRVPWSSQSLHKNTKIAHVFFACTPEST